MPRTAPLWRVVALIPLPIPSWAGPRSRTHTATIVANPSPTPTPISTMAGSHSATNAGSGPTWVASHTPEVALMTAPGRTNRRGSTRSVKRPATTAVTALASGPGAIASPARSTE